MQAKTHLLNLLTGTLTNLGLSWPEKAMLEPPREKKFGDLACNAAMILSSQAGKNPRQLAEEIRQALLEQDSFLDKIDIAGPGFLNFTFKKDFWLTVLDEIQSQDKDYGSSFRGQDKKVQVEYVSANPTGPLHIGHGRGAAVGDSLARIMRFAGYDVSTEYYLNDAGRQMNILGESTWIRYQNLAGRDIALSGNHYQGDYLIQIAAGLKQEYGPGLLEMEESRAVAICREAAVKYILQDIKQDLKKFRVNHQVWFSEQSLIQDHRVEETFEWLRDRNMVYDHEGALWFRTTQFGDDKDRVLKKSDGSLTYFASDIAYHKNKFDRGFETVVDIWGADHHGYVPRMKSAVQAMGRPADSLRVILVQLVNLLREGSQVAMSTRAGEFITLKEVLDEVGVDACRFIFLSRRSDSHLDFDLEMVKRKSMDNPVFYVQYAHARICSLFAKAAQRNITIREDASTHLHLLNSAEDIDLLKKMHEFPEVVASSAAGLSPHHISYYLQDLAGLLHRYYTVHPVLAAKNSDLIQARMVLFRSVAIVIRNGLNLLGVTAPQKM
ncbi:MAG: arginine--tRNA ligase [Desulfonatronovibrionaceae bacterium]